VLPFFTFGYDDKTTHPALTQEIVKFFNASYPEKQINNTDAEKIIQGSIDEDTQTRWLYHFYDPVYNRGLVLEDDAFPKDPNLALVASGAKSEWESSKTWGTNSELQSGIIENLSAGIFTEYFSGNKDYSWNRAIYEYAWEDKNRGLLSLGHILHLIEDASVPDHTRNDAHPQFLDLGSPYEAWTKKFTRQTINSSLTGEKPIIFSNIGNYFDSLANYSNNNFFSKDTVFIKEFKTPVISFYRIENLSDSLVSKFGYGYINGDLYKLVRINVEFSWKDALDDKEDEFLITDRDNLILTDYWTRLSKQSVLHGAGVIKLFLDEVEKEKQTKTLYNKNRSWIGKTYDAVSNTVSGWWDSTTNAVSNVYTNTAGNISNLWNNWSWGGSKADSQGSPSTSSGTIISGSRANLAGSVFSLGTDDAESSPSIESGTKNNEPGTDLQSSPLTSSGTNLQGSPSTRSGTINSGSGINYPPQIAGVSIAFNPIPTAPPVSPPSSNTSSIVPIAGGGGAPPAPTPPEPEPSPTTPPPEPEPEPSPPEPPPQTPPSEPEPEPEPPPDTEPPDITLNIHECADSLSPDTCLLASTTITLIWSSVASDLLYYEISCESAGNACPDFLTGTTSATSTTYYTPPLPAKYIFSAKAVDINGNVSNPTVKTVEIYLRPLVINEIAWMGTSSDQPNDEWIELKNLTEYPITLNQWLLRSKTDNTPYIKLSGEIPTNGFIVLERTDETTISDQTAHQIYTGSLINHPAEVLELSRASSTVDETPAIEACNGWWCGGEAGGAYYSMERHDPEDEGTDPTNWGTWQGFLQNGKNADGVKINGTPGARNTVNYLISRGGTALISDKTLKKQNSPYIIPQYFAITPDATLTLEPGTVIKFLQGGSILAEGKILAAGSAENPAVFTSFKDDEYAGDTNQDGSTSSPQARDWSSIKLRGPGSQFDHAIFRFGGIPDSLGESWAMLRANDTDISVKNSVFEKSGAYGLWLANTSGVIESSVMRDNTDGGQADGVGLVATDGNLEIRGNTFENNGMGLRLTSAGAEHSLKITENIFRQNESFAAQSIGAYPEFSENTAMENGINGINIQGTVQKDFTLWADLPYVIQNTIYMVEPEKILTIKPGTILKFQGGGGINVQGVLNAIGTEDQKIVFTSLYDDEYGGDTDGTTTPTVAAGDWMNISFLDGSAGSSLEHATIKFGGTKSMINPNPGALRAENSSFELDNVVVDNNYLAGIFLKSSSSAVIKNSIIQNHQAPNIPSPSEPSYGLFLENSSAALESVLFRANKVGIIALASSTISATNITFEGNENETDTIPTDLLP